MKKYCTIGIKPIDAKAMWFIYSIGSEPGVDEDNETTEEFDQKFNEWNGLLIVDKEDPHYKLYEYIEGMEFFNIMDANLNEMNQIEILKLLKQEFSPYTVKLL